MALEAGGFLVVADFSVFMTVLLAGGGAAGLAALDAGLVAVVFLTTVAVLPSEASEVALTFLRPRVEAAVGGREGAAAWRVRVAAVPAPAPALVFELAVDEVVAFLVPAVGRVALALSTMLERRLEEALGGPLTGDAGRLNVVLAGDAGRSRGTIRVFDDVGERICPG